MGLLADTYCRLRDTIFVGMFHGWNKQIMSTPNQTPSEQDKRELISDILDCVRTGGAFAGEVDTERAIRIVDKFLSAITKSKAGAKPERWTGEQLQQWCGYPLHLDDAKVIADAHNATLTG